MRERVGEAVQHRPKWCCTTFDPEDLKSLYFPEFRKTLPSMEGKVVAITGCTSGTGFAVAKVMVELKAKVVMLNRPSKRADHALDVLKEHMPGADVSLVHIDMMSFKSVRAAGVQVCDKVDRIDVFVCNAGVTASKDAATEDGCDIQMQVNHLSHFLLVSEIWPLLEKAVELGGEARVVSVTSDGKDKPANKLAARYLNKNGGNLGGDKSGCLPFSGAQWARYQQSRLANFCFFLALHNRLKETGKSDKIKSLVCHPGTAATDALDKASESGGYGWCFNDALHRISQTTEDGIMGMLTCICFPSSKSGEFYAPKGLTGPAISLPMEALADEDSCKLLWEESVKVTHAVWPAFDQ